MSLLHFIKDRDYDAEMISVMLKGRSEQGILEYAKTIGVSPEDARRIAAGDQALAEMIAEIRYAEAGNKLNGVIEAYQQGWDEIDQQFFDRLVELTKFPLAHESYECVVSLFHPGISNWGGNKVVRIWNKDSEEQRRITAHELIISHFFSLMHKKHSTISSQNIWKLAEVYAFAVTGLDPIMRTFWPWDNSGAYTDHNYPEIVQLQKDLTHLYPDINAFVEKGLALV